MRIKVVREPPFELCETGWGEFDMEIAIHFTDPEVEPHLFTYDLKFEDDPDTVEEALVGATYLIGLLHRAWLHKNLTEVGPPTAPYRHLKIRR